MTGPDSWNDGNSWPSEETPKRRETTLERLTSMNPSQLRHSNLTNRRAVHSPSPLRMIHRSERVNRPGPRPTFRCGRVNSREEMWETLWVRGDRDAIRFFFPRSEAMRKLIQTSNGQTSRNSRRLKSQVLCVEFSDSLLKRTTIHSFDSTISAKTEPYTTKSHDSAAHQRAPCPHQISCVGVRFSL